MNRKYLKWWIGATLSGIAIILLDALFLEKYFFQIKTFQIGKSNSSKKLKIILLTDLHFKYRLWPFYKKLAKTVNALEADLILFAGDTLDTFGTLKPAKKFFNMLHQHTLKAAILGNHDHESDIKIRDLKEVYQNHNCTLLINESQPFYIKGERIMVTGLDDFIEGKSSFEKAVKDVGKENNHFLLVHSPLQQETAIKEMKKVNERRSAQDQLNIQYIFAGHNHGGQITFFGFVPVLPKKSGHYINGWYNNESPYLYVSKGFGTTALPFRFCSRSEMTVFEYGLKVRE